MADTQVEDTRPWDVQRAYDLYNGVDHAGVLGEFIDAAEALLDTDVGIFDRIQLLILLGHAVADPAGTMHFHSQANAQWRMANTYAKDADTTGILLDLREGIDRLEDVVRSEMEGEEQGEGEEEGEIVGQDGELNTAPYEEMLTFEEMLMTGVEVRPAEQEQQQKIGSDHERQHVTPSPVDSGYGSRPSTALGLAAGIDTLVIDDTTLPTSDSDPRETVYEKRLRIRKQDQQTPIDRTVTATAVRPADVATVGVQEGARVDRSQTGRDVLAKRALAGLDKRRKK